MHKMISRSENMSRIRSKDTIPELMLRRALWANGLRYRMYYDLIGKPDLVFIKSHLAIFVDGCFWHGCPEHYSAPNTRREFWETKLRRSVLRDFKVDETLASTGWGVLRIWQHELKDIENIVLMIRNIILKSNNNFKEERPTLAISESFSHKHTGFNKKCQELWFGCDCGSIDVRVLSVSNPGSLRLKAKKRPVSCELICRTCKKTRNIKVPMFKIG